MVTKTKNTMHFLCTMGLGGDERIFEGDENEVLTCEAILNFINHGYPEVITFDGQMQK